MIEKQQAKSRFKLTLDQIPQDAKNVIDVQRWNAQLAREEGNFANADSWTRRADITEDMYRNPLDQMLAQAAWKLFP